MLSKHPKLKQYTVNFASAAKLDVGGLKNTEGIYAYTYLRLYQ